MHIINYITNNPNHFFGVADKNKTSFELPFSAFSFTYFESKNAADDLFIGDNAL
ncbi:hypothetical protein L0657_23955 [Dyadobacter sp. CY345]|uniref:hypothetical protein n=1 Tax=Dyadobacter sp. CY345 TaxID=2909335 RepID=UPI001F335215|nr:hypothetical protein [Dyadobacter sp. CY345]MCF2447029.1 hypothetical protein [Dyadobacter sp. CY345]